jgi:DNA-binding response OmpR family regulator
MGNTILVIDDEQSICDLIALALKNKGFEVLTSMTGEGGINIARERMPGLVLLDIKLNDMKGDDVASSIKKFSRDIPIVVMSGSTVLESQLDRSLFDGILNKPFNLASLVATATKYCTSIAQKM